MSAWSECHQEARICSRGRPKRYDHFGATDPRDKVFTMLGISDEDLDPFWALWGSLDQFEIPEKNRKDVEAAQQDLRAKNASNIDRYSRPILKADYSKELIDTYTDLTRYLVRIPIRTLEVLTHMSHLCDPTEASFPSWAPKWFQKQSAAP